MGKYDALVERVVETIKEERLAKQANTVTVGISNRHLHLSRGDIDLLFGTGYELTNIKDISQPGQFACKETVTMAGPKGVLEKVRVLGPARKESQVEILKADCFKLGIDAPLKMSGELEGTPGITLIGPKGSIVLPRGVIIAMRHVHMLPEDALRFGVTDGQSVSIGIDGPRGGTLGNVIVRVTNTSALDCHIDTEEGNAMNLKNGSRVTIIK